MASYFSVRPANRRVGGKPRGMPRAWNARELFERILGRVRDKDELAQQSRLAGSIHHGCRDCHSIACRSIIELGRGTRADLEKFIRQIIRSREISELHSGYGSEVTSRRIVDNIHTISREFADMRIRIF